MTRPTVSAPPELFRSPLLPAAAVCYIAALVPGVLCALSLLLPGTIDFLIADLFRGGTGSGEALITWCVFHISLILLGLAGCGAMALGLVTDLWVRPGRGMGLLRKTAQGLYYALHGFGAVLGVVFVYRFVRFLVINLPDASGLYASYAMVISEGLTGSLAVGAFLLLRNFLDCACRSAASMCYTRYSGLLDSVSIPGFTATGFLILGILGLILALERVSTLTIAWALQPYYKLILADHPVLILASVLYILGAAGNILISIFLRRYKRTTERLLFRNRTRMF